LNYLRNPKNLLNFLLETFSFKNCPSLLILESKFVFADLQYRLFC